MQYWTCSLCGANLDFGEKCDCQEQDAILRKYHIHNKKYVKNMEDIKDEFIPD